MNRVITSVQIDAPAERVWALLGSVSSVNQWHPMLATCVVDGDQRECEMVGGGLIKERIISQDPAGMTYTYAIVAAPVPIVDYVGRFTVRPVGAARCTVEWRSTFAAAGGADEAMVELMTQIMTTGFEGLAKKMA